LSFYVSNTPATGNWQRATFLPSAITLKNKSSLFVSNLGKRFGREWIFRKLTYSFESGKTYAITGANGSGKSTLMQILWGQSPPTTGDLSYSCGDTTVPVEEIYQHVSIATPYMDLIDEFTLLEQIEFHFKLKKIQQGMTTNDLIERMYLTKNKDKVIGNFSSGMKQRVKLGLAFFTEANLLFLDEPGTNLDKNAFEWYLDLLTNKKSDSIIFIASNNPEEYPGTVETVNIMGFK
jgi:ABC-type multidrug transport system ATPase subunit